MGAGKIRLQASDGKVLSLTAPDGMLEDLESVVAKVDGGNDFTGVQTIDGENVENYVASRSNYGFKNYIINGGFDVWQRGENFTSQGYTADRWFGNLSGATGIFSKVSNDDISGLSNIRSNNRIRCVTTVANDYSGFFQRIEGVRTLSGKIATLSFWAYNAKSTQTLYLQLVQENLGVIGNSNIELVSMPNGWTKVVATFNIPDIPNNTTISVNSCLELFIVVQDNALVDFSICDVQLEEGSVATPFEQRPYGLELSLCQRYGIKINSERVNSSFAGLGALGDGTNICSVSIPLPVSPRLLGEDAAVVTKSGDMAVNAYASNGNNITSVVGTRINATNAQIVLNTSASLVNGTFYRFSGAADAYFFLDFEL